jgi:VanZ family protein
LRASFKIIFLFTLFAIELLAFQTNNTNNITLGWDKLNHMVAFMTLYLLVSLSFRNLTNNKYKIILLLAVAVQIEIVQSFLPNREPSLLDIIADVAGVVAGYILWRKIFNPRRLYRFTSKKMAK